MAIPYHDHLRWHSYRSESDWPNNQPASPTARNSQLSRVVNELFQQTCKQSVVRSVQFIRDTARLILKVPFRSMKTPIVLEKNWKQRERAKINAKLTGYSFIQLTSIPAKFLVALVALGILPISQNTTKELLDKSESWTAYLDGRASQLEALKEEGRQHAQNREEYNRYKTWLYSIDPKLCRKKESNE